jgi:hypothetical protein
LVVPKRCEEGLHEEIREIAFVILRRKPSRSIGSYSKRLKTFLKSFERTLERLLERVSKDN